MSKDLVPQANHLGKLAPLEGYERQTLEGLLNALCAAGMPRILRMDKGWVCCVDMHVASAGTEFKIRSEYDCETPLASARQCAGRVIQTLQQWI